MTAKQILAHRVESCTGLIVKQANKAYNRLSQDHKRWVDPEDLIQDGRLAAVQLVVGRKAKMLPDGTVDLATGPHYTNKLGTKYSTYLYTGLDWYLDKNYYTPMRQQKRTIGNLVELDAPLPDRESTIQVASSEPIQDTALDAVMAFVTLCQSLEAKAVIWLTAGLLFGKSRSGYPVIPAIRQAVTVTGVQYDQLKILIKSPLARTKVLTMLEKDATIDLGTEADSRVLECSECEGQFSLIAIRQGRFFPESMTCRTCYRKLQTAPVEKSCFGKIKTTEHEGFSTDDPECRLHCIDRRCVT